MIGQLLFLGVVAIAAIRLTWGFRSGRLIDVAITATGSLSYVFFLLVPAYLQTYGLIESKLSRANLAGPPTLSDIDQLCLGWTLELLVVIVAEIFVTQMKRAPANQSNDVVGVGSPVRSTRQAKAVVNVLLVIGLMAYILFPVPELEDRADTGQGLGTVLRGFVVCGLALLIYYKFFSSRAYLVVALAGIGGLILANVRSPLVVLFLAFVAAGLNSGYFASGRRLAAAGLVVVTLVVVGSTMSNLRENSTRNLGYSSTQVIGQTLENPWTAPYEAGIDTLDGYRLSQIAARREPAHPESLLTVVTTFVPRSIWEDKPESLSVEISRSYLGYRASGQFLSPVGYFRLAFGSYTAAVGALFVFSMLSAFALRRSYGSLWLIFVLVAVFRFELGGSPFDVYYALVLALSVWLVRAVVVLAESSYETSLLPKQ